MDPNTTPNPNVDFDVNEIFKDDNETPILKEVTPETDSGTEPTKEPVEGDKKPDDFVKEELEPEIRKMPLKMADESEENYQLRIQLRDAKIARDEAESDEEKSFFIDKIKEVKRELGKNDRENKAKVAPIPDTETDEDEAKSIRENLAKLGFKTEEETNRIIEEKLAQVRGEEIANSQLSAVKQFYAQRPDIYKNKEARDWLENYVLNEYKVDITTNPKKILEYFNNTSKAYFPKQPVRVSDDSKTDLLNISSNTKADATTYKAPVNDSDFLKKQGWSDSDLATLY
jgi:hypothetical protein